MHTTLLLTTTLTLALTTLAQLNLPTCANSCFTSAISASSCSPTDYLCQCTTGQTAIQAAAIPCLCHSTCTSTDLLSVIQDSNSVCSSALSAAGRTYTAAAVGLGACASMGSAATGSSTAAAATATGSAAGSAAGGSATGSAASATGASMSSSGSGSMTATAVQQTASSGAGMKAVYGCGAVLGLAGLAALAL
ncbi:SWI/SNF and RSC complex subunit Ssr1 [Friedmanniomyces endolithicus]|uniref:SWI/SNF and RSC complex subunit Ssr1 n=1 Tax=Friedmanniomyces endolithicus TaxID=329885 RepID=A0AAN6QUH4_9PEZI|nr:SWI/SNF and RSC complex subunit Ssr1 [Friedmanniomyces endolithicus]KAK0802527.1 SWI/SNF and RSC complex subunit Ssr1 [Friedmanniomyces endolithicus]KAK0812869.1 SWI/SNF and RSC complex subunit Ssr1 [Friedmanniomyces endolithicus]KAK0818890.1 SWI/SNF and RSC complex subunit Ssr1 [Friedmanniomyces endolithicus]KAK0842953.1 SWI/SNF and RSC complex subunit Ssr1 [Friedmanniomyces endolithicus]